MKQPGRALPADSSDQGVRDLLRRYQRAIMHFSADELGSLYAPDGVHEFGFVPLGHSPRYVGPQQVRDAYAQTWQEPAVDLVGIRDIAVHETADPACLVDEWVAQARRRTDGELFSLAGVLVLTAREGLVQHLRDYMDVFGLVVRTGRLRALADRLEPDHQG